MLGPSQRGGAWQFGSASINGWRWVGFDRLEHMHAFQAAWPDWNDDLVRCNAAVACAATAQEFKEFEQ